MEYEELLCIGIDYKKTPIDKRSLFAFDEAKEKLLKEKIIEGPEEIRGGFKPGIKEPGKYYKTVHGVVVLSTCNRSEVYLSIANVEADQTACCLEFAEDLIMEVLRIDREDFLSCVYEYTGRQACVHLYRVTAGLDSMITGEDEIQRQVKDAYMKSLAEKNVTNEMNMIFQGALKCSRDIKNNTRFKTTPVSYGTLAANLIEDFLGDSGKIFDGSVKKNTEDSGRDKGSKDGPDPVIVIVGITGQIGSILARDLYDKGLTNIIGTSRSHGPFKFIKAESMYEFKARYELVDKANVIVSATRSPHYTFTLEKTAKAICKVKPRLFIDLAVPHDIDSLIKRLPQVTLYDIDSFIEMAEDNRRIKEHESLKAQDIIDEDLEELYKNILIHRLFEDPDAFDKVKDQSFEKVFLKLKKELGSGTLEDIVNALKNIDN
ncbi:MAG: hypothetical protein VZR00_01865 [Lachnospiraceae bacterium]|nr:hypothetical protein [Lachnospiraceae bacterium]MEE3460621.1 hypothetical protein [Lachnospiraceae bacterium]